MKIGTILCFFVASVSWAQAPIRSVWYDNIKNSLNSVNKANSIRLDDAGNCYILGTTWAVDSAKDIMLVKFTSTGDEQWRRTYNNPSRGDDIPMAMCVDKFGNTWVGGMARLSEENADFLVVKFTPDGIPISSDIYDGRDHLFDCAMTITDDKAGNVYAAGYETSIDAGLNMVLVKYYNDGSVAWRVKYSTRQMDIANKLMTDDSCNVYVVGAADSGPRTGDILIQKYDSTGKKKWEIFYDGPLSEMDLGQYIVSDDSMNIYVSGFINHSNSRADIPVLKINRNGQILQDVLYYGKIADCGATDIYATKKSVYITGDCDDYNISQEFTLVSRFDKGGKQQFELRAPTDVQFMVTREIGEETIILGSKLTHPESTLMPYIASIDTTEFLWEFADSTVYGLARMTDFAITGKTIYFLGDDTGDATGTIYIFRYDIDPSVLLKEEEPDGKNKK